jgi:hypothetical protein
MTDLSNPPFRADHVGSLLRPLELLWVRAEHQAGRLSARPSRRCLLLASACMLLPSIAAAQAPKRPPSRLHFRRISLRSGAVR